MIDELLNLLQQKKENAELDLERQREETRRKKEGGYIFNYAERISLEAQISAYVDIIELVKNMAAKEQAKKGILENEQKTI